MCVSVVFGFDGITLEESLIFETIYDEELRMSIDEKQELIDNGAEFIFLIDSKTKELIGETYFVPLDSFEGLEPDEEQGDEGLEPYFGKNLAYCYSNTILPKYQGKGYGLLIKMHLLHYLEINRYSGVMGHAKEGASVSLNTHKNIKSKIVGEFNNWYGTGKTHYLYLKMFKKNK